jgi:hypothetical protein
MTQEQGTAQRFLADVSEPLTIKARLEYLRGEIEAERISMSEVAELQSLAEYIDPSDVVLLEWAGVPEHPEERGDTRRFATLIVKVEYCMSVAADSDEEAITYARQQINEGIEATGGYPIPESDIGAEVVGEV